MTQFTEYIKLTHLVYQSNKEIFRVRRLNSSNDLFKERPHMVNLINTLIHYLSISNDNDPIKRYCQTEFKNQWKEKYFQLTGKIPF